MGEQGTWRVAITVYHFFEVALLSLLRQDVWSSRRIPLDLVERWWWWGTLDPHRGDSGYKPPPEMSPLRGCPSPQNTQPARWLTVCLPHGESTGLVEAVSKLSRQFAAAYRSARCARADEGLGLIESNWFELHRDGHHWRAWWGCWPWGAHSVKPVSVTSASPGEAAANKIKPVTHPGGQNQGAWIFSPVASHKVKMKCWSMSDLILGCKKKKQVCNKVGLVTTAIKKGICTPVESWMKDAHRQFLIWEMHIGNECLKRHFSTNS